jgi:hypothetical protein
VLVRGASTATYTGPLTGAQISVCRFYFIGRVSNSVAVCACLLITSTSKHIEINELQT